MHPENSEMHVFFLHLINMYIKQNAHILAGCIVFRGRAPDVCMGKFLNFGHYDLSQLGSYIFCV